MTKSDLGREKGTQEVSLMGPCHGECAQIVKSIAKTGASSSFSSVLQSILEAPAHGFYMR